MLFTERLRRSARQVARPRRKAEPFDICCSQNAYDVQLGRLRGIAETRSVSRTCRRKAEPFDRAEWNSLMNKGI